MGRFVFHVHYLAIWLEGKRLSLPFNQLVATSYVRSLGVPCSQYIDDRHNGQLRLPPGELTPPPYSGFQLAEMAAFIALSTFISLGCFIGIKKKKAAWFPLLPSDFWINVSSLQP